jgi:hypothetical protein
VEVFMLLELVYKEILPTKKQNNPVSKALISRDCFEGVDLGLTVDLDQLVAIQLSKGQYSGEQDQSPSDWLIRAWGKLSPEGQDCLSSSVHRVLLHESPTVRAEAVRTLDVCSHMAQPQLLLYLAEHHFDLFRGVRRAEDPPDMDRGSDFVQLVCAVAGGAEGSRFRREMAFDPTYGGDVLPSLVRHEPDWVVDHIARLVHLDLDPLGFRLQLLLSRLQGNTDRLRRVVANLAGKGPALRARLRMLLRRQIHCPELYAELLALMEQTATAGKQFPFESMQIYA